MTSCNYVELRLLTSKSEVCLVYLEDVILAAIEMKWLQRAVLMNEPDSDCQNAKGSEMQSRRRDSAAGTR